MPRISASQWVDEMVDSLEAQATVNFAHDLIPAIKESMKEARTELYNDYGEGVAEVFANGDKTNVRVVYRSGSTNLSFDITTYLEDSVADGATPPTDCAEWMDEHSRDYGLSAKYGSPGRYYYVHLILEQGIIGLPAVGTWQNEPGLSPRTSYLKSHLAYKRRHPWHNPEFHQKESLNSFMEGRTWPLFLEKMSAVISALS